MARGRHRARCIHDGCPTQPSFGVLGTRMARYCAHHAPDGMVKVERTCVHEGCTTYGSFGVAGSRKAEFCAEHAHDDMVRVRAKRRCSHEDCSKYPSYGVLGVKTAEYCVQHAPDGMVNVKKGICIHEGCTKHRSYGVAGSRKAEFCAEHAHEGMVCVRVKRRCSHRGCYKYPSYGTEGTRKKEFCKQHAPAATGTMIPLYKRCSVEGCYSRPSHGVAGSKEAAYCAQHCDEGMMRVKPPYECSHEGCSEEPSHGVAGTRKSKYCAQHARDGMVYIKRRETCAYESCSKRPSFGVPGTGTVEYCALHAVDGMINVSKKRHLLQACTDRPSSGVAGSRKAKSRAQHAIKGMVHVRPDPSHGLEGARGKELHGHHTAAAGELIPAGRKKHSIEDCPEEQTYGRDETGKPTLCGHRAEPALVGLVSGKCSREGCSKVPSDGVSGTRKTDFCLRRAGKEMVCVEHDGRVPDDHRSNPPVSHPEVKLEFISHDAREESSGHRAEPVGYPLEGTGGAGSGSNDRSVKRPHVTELHDSRVGGELSLRRSEFDTRPLANSAKVKTEVSAPRH